MTMLQAEVARSESLVKPLRFACNRCHAQKLRCPRSNTFNKNGLEEPCQRCRKAQKPCIVSSPNKVGRPPKVSKKKTTSASTSPSQTISTASRTTSATTGVSHSGDDLRPAGGHRSSLSLSALDTNEDLLMFNLEHLQTPMQAGLHSGSIFTAVSDSAMGVPTTTPSQTTVASAEGTDDDDADDDDVAADGLKTMWPTQGQVGGLFLFDQDQEQHLMQHNHFTMDMMEVNLPADPPTYPDFPPFENLELHSSNGQMTSINENTTPDTHGFFDESGNEGSLLASSMADFLFQTQDTEHMAIRRSDAPLPNLNKAKGFETESQGARPSTNTEASLPSPDHSTSQGLNISYLQTLTDLHTKILRLSEESNVETNHTNDSKAGMGQINGIVSELVQLSGALIDIYSQMMPRSGPSGASPSQSSGSSSRSDIDSRTRSANSSLGGQYLNLEIPLTSSFASSDFLSGSGVWAIPKTGAQGHTMLECTAIFLLMGCYAQIMHIFETTINSLRSHHRSSIKNLGHNTSHSNTAGSLLETPLHVHTITYLLGCLKKALFTYQTEDQGSTAVNNWLHNSPHESQASAESWSACVFGQMAGSMLVGRAFYEIRTREQSLMRKIAELKQIVNRPRDI